MPQQKEIRGSWVVPGGAAGEWGWCMRCGAGLKAQTSTPVYLAAALMKAFADHHADCPDIGYKEPVPKTPEEWARSRDVGVSAGTIYAAVMGGPGPLRHFDVPHDPDDFGRCYRLLQLFPTWRADLGKTVNLCGKWKPFVEAWDELTALYKAAQGSPSKAEATSRWERLYARMQQLEKAAG